MNIFLCIFCIKILLLLLIGFVKNIFYDLCNYTLHPSTLKQRNVNGKNSLRLVMITIHDRYTYIDIKFNTNVNVCRLYPPLYIIITIHNKTTHRILTPRLL